MQSFMTILIAGCAAFMASLLLNDAPAKRIQLYALEIALEENGEVYSVPQVLVEPGKSYQIALEAGADYEVAIEIPEDGQAASLTGLEEIQEDASELVMLVNTEVLVEQTNLAVPSSPEQSAINANLLLNLAGPAREFRSILPVAGRGLLTRTGSPIESLAITIKSAPFSH